VDPTTRPTKESPEARSKTHEALLRHVRVWKEFGIYWGVGAAESRDRASKKWQTALKKSRNVLPRQNQTDLRRCSRALDVFSHRISSFLQKWVLCTYSTSRSVMREDDSYDALHNNKDGRLLYCT